MPAPCWSLEGDSANGNFTSDGLGQSYSYDPENRLISASGPKNATLGYDPMGRLAQVSDVATRRMAYDGDALAEEYDGSGNLLRRFVHGPGVDDPIVWYEGSGLTDRRFLHADHQGSIVAISDGNGDASAINKYDEYGVPQSGFTGRFGYTGQAWVPELELWYYKARFYSPRPEIGGRFLQVDPVGYDDQINLYAYVGNDPPNNGDPSGMCTGSRIENKDETCVSTGGFTTGLNGLLQGAETVRATVRRATVRRATDIAGDAIDLAGSLFDRFTLSAAEILEHALGDDIPEDALKTAEKFIDQGYEWRPDQFYRSDKYSNVNQKLPLSGDYVRMFVREADAVRLGYNPNERLIVDKNSGKAWYTNDKYQTFTRIR